MRVALIASGGCWSMPMAAPPEDKLRAVLHVSGGSAPVPTDPMDRALHETAALVEPAPTRRLLQTHGLRPDLFATTNIWRQDDRGTVKTSAKGAPETIADLCHLPGPDRDKLLQTVDRFAAQGFGCWRWRTPNLPRDGVLPASQRDIPDGYGTGGICRSVARDRFRGGQGMQDRRRTS